jgi:hypothetical protein
MRMLKIAYYSFMALLLLAFLALLILPNIALWQGWP